MLSWAILQNALNSSPVPQTAADLVAALGYIPFQDSENAKRAFLQITNRLSSSLASTIPALLLEAPDPDSALVLFDRLVSHDSPDILRLIEFHPRLVHYALIVFSHSQFLGDTLIHSPDLLGSFLEQQSLDRSYSREEFELSLTEYRSRLPGADISTILAGFKRREYVRILLRDVLKIAALGELTTEISALADVLLQAALDEAGAALQRRYGWPQNFDSNGRAQDTSFAILSFGKLGGNELNYFSDVDLMFLFGDGAEAPGSSISIREYFIRLAQEVTKILSCASPQGPVFRIDLRLRPQGGEGELAISLPQALRYYATTAHDWELQALIKVRHSAGDAALSRRFIDGVRPHVYTENANFAAIKTALVAREKMQKRRPANLTGEDAALNVKIDGGGIRDIEFLVQCLQRVYGGAEHWLQSSGTLFSLQKLHDNGHLSGNEFQELSTSYEFLRTLEHRLQLRRGQQTHRMPISGPDLQILERSMGRFDPAQHPEYEFVSVVRQRMAVVADIYQRVIYQQQSRKAQTSGVPSSIWLPGRNSAQPIIPIAKFWIVWRSMRLDFMNSRFATIWPRLPARISSAFLPRRSPVQSATERCFETRKPWCALFQFSKSAIT